MAKQNNEEEHSQHPDRLPIILDMFESRDTKFQSLAKIVAEHGVFLKIIGVVVGTIGAAFVAVFIEFLFTFFSNLK
jgi:hypothetical protein